MDLQTKIVIKLNLFQSEALSNAIYSCDWLSLPKLMRRDFLIAMQLFSRPLIIHVGCVVPISVGTFIAVSLFK